MNSPKTTPLEAARPRRRTKTPLTIWIADNSETEREGLRAAIEELYADKPEFFENCAPSLDSSFHSASKLLRQLERGVVPDVILADVVMGTAQDGAARIFDELRQSKWDKSGRPLLIGTSKHKDDASVYTMRVQQAGAYAWADYIPKPREPLAASGEPTRMARSPWLWLVGILVVRWRMGALERSRISTPLAAIAQVITDPVWGAFRSDMERSPLSGKTLFVVRAATSCERLWMAEALADRFSTKLDPQLCDPNHAPANGLSFNANVFGTERGKTRFSKTNGNTDGPGWLAAAERKNGTLMLDGFEAAPAALQDMASGLDRLLKHQTFTPLGAETSLPFRGRLVLGLKPGHDLPSSIDRSQVADITLPPATALPARDLINAVLAMLRLQGIDKPLPEVTQRHIATHRSAWSWEVLHNNVRQCLNVIGEISPENFPVPPVAAPQVTPGASTGPVNYVLDFDFANRCLTVSPDGLRIQMKPAQFAVFAYFALNPVDRRRTNNPAVAKDLFTWLKTPAIRRLNPDLVKFDGNSGMRSLAEMEPDDIARQMKVTSLEGVYSAMHGKSEPGRTLAEKCPGLSALLPRLLPTSMVDARSFADHGVTVTPLA